MEGQGHDYLDYKGQGGGRIGQKLITQYMHTPLILSFDCVKIGQDKQNIFLRLIYAFDRYHICVPS